MMTLDNKRNDLKYLWEFFMKILMIGNQDHHCIFHIIPKEILIYIVILIKFSSISRCQWLEFDIHPPYFINTQTGAIKNQSEAPDNMTGWIFVREGKKLIYYYNIITDKTQWDIPEEYNKYQETKKLEKVLFGKIL